jgi:glycolate oxidase
MFMKRHQPLASRPLATRPHATRPLTPEILDLLRRELGPDAVLTDPGLLDEYGKDESGLCLPPQAVIKAHSTEQVANLLQLANEHRFPVTPRGGGTGLAGGCVPVLGGVVLSLREMNRILSIDESNMLAVVQPGVLNQDLKDAAKAVGLCYPPDPASLDTSTIGGNAATNAGGPACVKYGVTRQYVLGLTAVLPTGEIVHTGGRTRKNVVGYDLTQLLVGSEGTLGVITELTLRLIPHPAAVQAMAVVFPDLTVAMKAVTGLLLSGCTPSALEFLDSKCLHLVGDLLPFAEMGESAAMLLIETDGEEEQVEREMDRISALCWNMGASHLLPAEDEARREELWTVRRQVSVRIHDTWPVYVPEDVAVPIGRIAELVRDLPELEQRYGVTIYAFGHSGDGNIHLNITATDRDHMGPVEDCVEDVLKRVVAMQGTISGEHGIGFVKKAFMPWEIGKKSIEIQRGMKHLFDPNMVLNPGKLFQEDGDDS